MRPVTLCLFLAGAAAVAAAGDGDVPPVCEMADAQRVDCGFVGITPDECEAKDCCYFKSTSNHPFCYFKEGKAPAEAVMAARQCEFLDEERIDCGYDGVSDSSCQARGCCYQHAATPGAPFCFYKRGQQPSGAVKGSATGQCVMPDADRVDCGFDGVTPEACHAKGCCYFHSHTPGSPYCYFKAKGSTARMANNSREDVGSMCEVPGGERKDCGFEGISQPECEAEGCCYGPTDVAGAPFCYYRSNPATEASSASTSKSPARSSSHSEAAATTAAPEPEAHEGPVHATVAPASATVAPKLAAGAPDAGARVVNDASESAASRSAARSRGGDSGGDAAQSRFRRADSEKSEPLSRQTLMTMLAAFALILVVITGCCLRTTPSSEDGEENKPLKGSQPTSPRGATTRRLEPGTDRYQDIEKQFVQKWDTTSWPTGPTGAGRAVPPPRIAAIYEVDSDNRLPAYKEKMRIIDSSKSAAKIAEKPGNEQLVFHGARLKYSSQGTPCLQGMPSLDSKCSVCRIIESGSFACDNIGGEIHFRAGSHAAKGQGLAPGKTPPPESLDDFVSNTAGNAVFLANVLLGTPQIVTERTKGRLPAGTHSRIAEKAYGVDEIVVFDEAQAIPKALILFH